jgi:hypothetical protein
MGIRPSARIAMRSTSGNRLLPAFTGHLACLSLLPAPGWYEVILLQRIKHLLQTV